MSTQKTMATLNASSHSVNERAELDFYATPPKAVKMLLELEVFNKNIWECACGLGHISEELKKNGHEVYSTDIVDRGYGNMTRDFMVGEHRWNGDIITNPPYCNGGEFVEKALATINTGNKVAFLLRIQFLEGVKRRKMFDKFPPRKIYVASRNIRCARNGDFANATGNASTYAWFVWVKGNTDKPIIDWFN